MGRKRGATCRSADPFANPKPPTLSFSYVKMASSGRGALIVIEGLDRAGKSSQCELLFEHLKSNGHKVKRMRFPGKLKVAVRV